MAFIQAAATQRSGKGKGLSADNSLPERHIVVDLLRKAAPYLGLGAPVITTLDAMLSCLPPTRDHHTVFASNATLAFRRNGISDRTIRRHVADLQDAGLLDRRDSPNRKRYTRHNRHEGKVMRFGFDLSPLFARLRDLATLAARAEEEQEKLTYIRCKIRAVANSILIDAPDSDLAIEARKALRRKLSYTDCTEWLSKLTEIAPEPVYETDATKSGTERMAASDGQNVRHHHKSNIEIIDKRTKPHLETHEVIDDRECITIPELLEACPEATQFSLGKITSYSDVVTHARTLAPMIGIDSASYDAGQRRLGPLKTALTVWAIMQFHDKIKSVGAYFRSLTSGAKSDRFDPEKLIRRLAMGQRFA